MSVPPEFMEPNYPTGGPYPWSAGVPASATPAAEQRRETERRREASSRFARAAEAAGLPSPQDVDLEAMLRAAGVDTSEPAVQQFIAAMRNQDLDPAILQAYVAMLAEKYPAVPVTAYAQALELSGFTRPPIVAGVTTPSELQGVPAESVLTPGERFVQHPETGWLMFRNGVLVNPADGSVVFEPNSMAPGSPNWLQRVQETWSDEQVMSWKKRLAEFGYLTEEQAKTKGIDQAFLEGLQQYHIDRYRNFGKPVPRDLSGQAGGAGDFALTARDFQAQIRGDVREQFRRVFGNDPSDAELEEWTRFVTQTALRLQKRFERRGASPEAALSLAATEAEERFIERLETSPEATFLRESTEENTRLRDALAAAAAVGRSLGA
ncbi:MAG TPA: hypothetical protein VNO79_11150 [Actinomycetota bacterium]|nr:hypothetical protein [Actinomycetota bacterium]